MDKNTYETIILCQYTRNLIFVVLERIYFKNGVVQEIQEEDLEQGCILDVCWNRNDGCAAVYKLYE